MQPLESDRIPIVGQDPVQPESRNFYAAAVFNIVPLAPSGYLSSKVTAVWPATAMKRCSAMPHLPREREREFFIANLLARIHYHRDDWLDRSRASGNLNVLFQVALHLSTFLE